MKMYKTFYVQKGEASGDNNVVQLPWSSRLGGREPWTTCRIRDRALKSSYEIRVPSDFIVIQTETEETEVDPQDSSSTAKCECGDHQTCETPQPKEIVRRMKLKFLLIGTINPPDLSFIDVNIIDTVQFHRSIVSDYAFFNATRLLPSIRKVKLFLGMEQTFEFQMWMEAKDVIQPDFVNKSVTSLTIITDEGIAKKVPNKAKQGHLLHTLEVIIVQILAKAGVCFPHLRKIDMNVFFAVSVERALIQVKDELGYLKPTIIETAKEGERLVVRLKTDEDNKDDPFENYKWPFGDDDTEESSEYEDESEPYPGYYDDDIPSYDTASTLSSYNLLNLWVEEDSSDDTASTLSSYFLLNLWLEEDSSDDTASSWSTFFPLDLWPEEEVSSVSSSGSSYYWSNYFRLEFWLDEVSAAIAIPEDNAKANDANQQGIIKTEKTEESY